MIKKIYFSILIHFFCFSLFSITQETASFENFLYGNAPSCTYDNWISHISEGIAQEDYNLYSPWDRQTNGFGDFTIASADSLQIWQQIFSAFLEEDFTQAQLLIDDYQLPFEVVEFSDTDTGETFYLIRENLNMDYFDGNGTATTSDDEFGSFDLGWGLYIFNPDATNPIIITVPHPNDDFIAPPIAWKSFVDWDAQFLFVNGAGREVKWTGYGNYSNSQSLSDPSRIEAHPLTRSYQLSCDKIRNDLGRREFSAQIHSYDWNRHEGHANCQVSAGGGQSCPNLPIRDLSNLHTDLINVSDHLIFSENTFGQHDEVYLNDYYAVNYYVYDFFFYNWNGDPYVVNSSVDLPGYGNNQQMNYTSQNLNQYDVFEPFFHLEMDELPDAFPQEENVYKWFYGFDENAGEFDFTELFTQTLNYYSYWVEKMNEVLPDVFLMDDGLDPETPTGFNVTLQSDQSVNLFWQSISSFDFHTYEILFAEEPISPGNFQIIDRDNNWQLASPLHANAMLSDLQTNGEYFFQIRAKDKNGNISPVSDELSITMPPVRITEFTAIGRDAKAELKWFALSQNENAGFNIYRSSQSQAFNLIASWETDPNLIGSININDTYTYFDETAENDRYYTYKVTAENLSGTEFDLDDVSSCEPQKVLQIMIANSEFTICDSVAFSKNIGATNYFDEYYDIEKTEEPPPNYIYAAFYEAYQPNGMYLFQNVKADYSPQNTTRSWLLKIRTNQLDQPISIGLEDELTNLEGNIFLEDLQTGETSLLHNDEAIVYFSNTEFKDFKLYWGNIQPQIEFSDAENLIYQSGEEVQIEWDTNFSNLIESQTLSLQNDSDSLFINSIPNGQSSYNWQIPPNVNIHYCRFVMDILTLEDVAIRETSQNMIGILPQEITLEFNEGWQLISNPWNSESALHPDQIFGNDSQLYFPIEHHIFTESEEFLFGKGYWLDSSQNGTFTQNAPIQKNGFTSKLVIGWNLLANPFLYEIEIKDLQFYRYGYLNSFYSIVNFGKIGRSVYLYNDGFQRTTKIPAQSSFYLYANFAHQENMKCHFAPYQSNNYYEFDEDWRIEIAATQFDRDEFSLGTSQYSSEAYDVHYDLPELPEKPFTDGIRAYLKVRGNQNFPFDKLDTEFKQTLSETQQDSANWHFAIKVNENSSINLEFDLSDITSSFTVDIFLDGNLWQDLGNNVYNYQIFPSQIGALNGILTVKNNLGSLETPASKKNQIRIYPNPFNPATTISFFLNKASFTKVTIYNLKGQKVQRLINKKLSAGQHSILWQGKDKNGKIVSSGIYFFQIEAGDFNTTKKMMMLK